MNDSNINTIENDLDTISVIDENGETQILPRAVVESHKIDYITIDEDKLIALANTLRVSNLIYSPEITEDNKIKINTMSKSLGLQSYDDEREFNAILSQNFTATGNTLFISNPEITTIGPEMFKESTNLKHIVLPFVNEIDDEAFGGISSKLTIYAPNCKVLSPTAFRATNDYGSNMYVTTMNLASITTIHNQGFCTMPNLVNVDFSNVTKIEHYGFGDCTSFESLYFPKLLTTEGYAFSGCSKLRKIECPKLTRLSHYDFERCLNIEEVIFPELVYLGNETFLNSTKIKSVSFPKLEFWGRQVFMSERPGIVSIDIPNAKTLDVTALNYCNLLTRLNMPNVITLGEEAVYYCDSLTDVNMISVETIGNYAFADCSSLPKVEFNKVNTIGLRVFSGCNSLETVIIRTPTVCEFTGSYIDCFPTITKIYVLDTLVEQYKTKYPKMSTQFHPLSELPS